MPSNSNNDNNNSNNGQDPWGEGLTRFNEAVTHSLTAQRLAAAGMVALGAAATAYLWDTNRRNAFLSSMRGATNPVTQWWSGSADKAGQSDKAGS